MGIKPLYARGDWIPNHPALQRHGWTGDQNGVAVTRGDECPLSFINNYEVSAELMWMSPTGIPRLMQAIPAGQSARQSSYLGHEFFFQLGQQKSNSVKCEEPEINFVLT